MISEETREKMRLAKLGKHHNHKTSNGGGWKVSAEGMENRRKSFNLSVIKNLKCHNRLGKPAWNKGLPSPALVERNKSNRRIGEKHWNWQGGKSPENRRLRRSIEFALWRKLVFERDGYTCQDCGKGKTFLHPHHLKSFAKFPELRFVVGNGITLCRDCHMMRHRKVA